jgi:putative membrane protein
MTEALTVLASSLLGSATGSFLACVPGLHVFSAAGLLAAAGQALHVPAGPVLAPFILSLTAAYGVTNVIASILMAAPDESALLAVRPGQMYLLLGRGSEGVAVAAAGGLVGLLALIPVLAVAGPRVLPAVRAATQPHLHWIAWCAVCFLLLSPSPQRGRLGQGGWRRLTSASTSTFAGLGTFALTGWLGFILMYRSPMPLECAYQNLMPAFVGLFALPPVILNVVSRVEAPRQERELKEVRLGARELLHGALAGTLGGGFAAFFPLGTGGIGGFLASHAAASRNERIVLAAQGAATAIYCVAGPLLLFVPGLQMTRGVGAHLLACLYAPQGPHDFHMALAAAAIGGAGAFLLVRPLSAGILRCIGAFGYRRLSACVLGLALSFVVFFSGLAGLAVASASAGLGLIPFLFGGRPVNALGVVLLPAACNLSGIGPTVARHLGLL